ncbi:MAG: IS66 family transposase [Gemmataceae bacterium]
MPAQRLTAVVPFVPITCQRCRAPLPSQASADDPEPTWHQFAELPPQGVHVTAYQGHSRTCGQCGSLNHAAIPADLRGYRFGPRLSAASSYLSGCHHVSRRGIVEVVGTVLDFPVSLGTVCRLEQETSQALQGAHDEALQAVRLAEVKHVEGTGWKKAGKRCWLWAAATANVAAFVLYAGRGAAGLTALLGTTIHGIIGSDRWSVYQGVAVAYRQMCWAHLKRDFQAMVDHGNSGSAVGTDLLLMMDGVFTWWYRVRDGTLRRRTLHLPRYAPELNADAYLNHDLKEQVNAAGLPHNKGEVRSRIQDFMRKLLRLPQHVVSYFQHPSAQYAAGINM